MSDFMKLVSQPPEAPWVRLHQATMTVVLDGVPLKLYSAARVQLSMPETDTLYAQQAAAIRAAANDAVDLKYTIDDAGDGKCLVTVYGRRTSAQWISRPRT